MKWSEFLFWLKQIKNRQNISPLINNKGGCDAMKTTMTSTACVTLQDCIAYDKLNNEDEFIEFLHFCADRLNKDEPVQAIWLAWKEKAAKK